MLDYRTITINKAMNIFRIHSSNAVCEPITKYLDFENLPYEHRSSIEYVIPFPKGVEDKINYYDSFIPILPRDAIAAMVNLFDEVIMPRPTKLDYQKIMRFIHKNIEYLVDGINYFSNIPYLEFDNEIYYQYVMPYFEPIDEFIKKHDLMVLNRSVLSYVVNKRGKEFEILFPRIG